MRLSKDILCVLEERKLPPFLPDGDYNLENVRANHRRQILDIEYGAFPQDKMAVKAKITSEEQVF